MSWWKRSRPHLCATIVEGLAIPQPFDLDAFCSSIAEQRGRPLYLIPLDGPADPEQPCGIWLGLDTADLVFYESCAADILKVQIVLHEIAHMLLGHVAPQLHPNEDTPQDEFSAISEHFTQLLARTGDAVNAVNQPGLPEIVRAEAARIRAAAARPAPGDAELGLSTDRILHLLGRTKFADRQEKEAETLATLILERASRNETISTSGGSADVLARLNDVLGHPGRRS
ncbi:hypothetical protein FB563_3437 [Streptomyces puniciscabiei]|uniref:IrrE N-terminal-like domain-containing protein n=1 Tax=Streptomyces puniciscabiei TaxID=164348 RepID=A0A542UH81_9ACTN|nr:hypothetical protein [Streptomyces puniciscabiei]TQK98411.1 hypothetical protein FB563_3437 [Streptomyces puniciscabiei]